MATLKLNGDERAVIIAEARAFTTMMLHRCKELYDGGPCLLMASAVTESLRRRGHEVYFQAGSASWPRLLPSQDDGKPGTFTHYSYVWDYAQAGPRLLKGILPEMHCWTVLRGYEAEIIDLTSGDQPEWCRKMTGMDWPGVRPQANLWVPVSKLPPGWYYTADPQAAKVALAVLKSVLTGDPVSIQVGAGDLLHP